MNPEENKAIVRDYLNDLVNGRNMTAVNRYFSDDVVFNDVRGFKQQLARMLAIRRAFPDHRLTIEDQIAEGDKIVTRVLFHATHQGEFRGIAATGRWVRYSGIAIDRIANGRVVEMWHLTNLASLLEQLGATPPPEPRDPSDDKS